MVICATNFREKQNPQMSQFGRDHSGCLRAVPIPVLRRSVLALRELIFLMTALEEGFKTTKKEE